MRRLFALFATVTAIGAAVLMLAGLLSGEGLLNALSDALLQIAVITAALTVLFGLANLLVVHAVRVRRREAGFLYSLVLIVSAVAVLGVWQFGNDAAQRVLLEDVQRSLESALAALLVFTLVFGAYRLLRRRVTWTNLLFIGVVLLVLAGALVPDPAHPLSQVRAWVLAVPVSAGARGLLLGIALATLVAAMRIFIGQERSVRDNR
jgi:hypothetical protein